MKITNFKSTLSDIVDSIRLNSKNLVKTGALVAALYVAGCVEPPKPVTQTSTIYSIHKIGDSLQVQFTESTSSSTRNAFTVEVQKHKARPDSKDKYFSIDHGVRFIDDSVDFLQDKDAYCLEKGSKARIGPLHRLDGKLSAKDLFMEDNSYFSNDLKIDYRMIIYSVPNENTGNFDNSLVIHIDRPNADFLSYDNTPHDRSFSTQDNSVLKNKNFSSDVNKIRGDIGKSLIPLVRKFESLNEAIKQNPYATVKGSLTPNDIHNYDAYVDSVTSKQVAEAAVLLTQINEQIHGLDKRCKKLADKYIK